MKHTRTKLNGYASKLGLDDPTKYPNKTKLIEAMLDLNGGGDESDDPTSDEGDNSTSDEGDNPTNWLYFYVVHHFLTIR